MTRLTDTPEWEALKTCKSQWKDLTLTTLFENDPNRFKRFSFQFDTLLFDFSKNLINEETFEALIALARARKVKEGIQNLFSGKHINASEDLPACHVALRDFSGNAFPEVNNQISLVRDKMKQFVNNVHQGTWRGYTGLSITHVVHVGVGGSLLGPMMVTKAFSYESSKLKYHFVSTLDGIQARALMNKVPPESTLFVIVSKSFKSEEVLVNAKILKQWFNENTSSKGAFGQHFVGVSMNSQAMHDFGIPPENQYPIWDFIGGRFSIWSAVGLVVALIYGFGVFDEFLKGAHAFDQHFLNEPLESNIPVIMALLSVWYGCHMGFASHVILPYHSYLRYLPAYLQQLEMESCGKQITQHGEKVDYRTGQVIWGGLGSNGEHAYFQLLHQGSEVVPADFIVPVDAKHANTNQDAMLAHALAQSQALMAGHHADLKKIFDGMNASENKKASYLYYPGNRPSTFITFPDLSPKNLGALMACYEHKIFAQAALLDINAFDQWGVELGKRLSKNLLHCLQEKETNQSLLDSSTAGLLKYIHKIRDAS